jgi:hypothetical protein
MVLMAVYDRSFLISEMLVMCITEFHDVIWQNALVSLTVRLNNDKYLLLLSASPYISYRFCMLGLKKSYLY